MSRPTFLPTRRQAALLTALALAALACGFYARYAMIERSAVGIACESGLESWLCATRRTAIALYTASLFGIVGLGAALLNLLRPSLVLSAIALAAAGLGIVLYNVVLSGFAVACLVLSLARPAPERD
jgi:hypothetical protein